ncbi:MAG: hypothetical protein AABX16_05080 [Nanoarchaeota archaeon]
MSLEKEIEKSNREIVYKLNEASKKIVVEYYMPLFEKVKVIALAHMTQSGISQISVGSLVFRKCGNFYSYSTYDTNGTQPLDIQYLPTFFDDSRKANVKEGYTQYQSEMELVLNEFRTAVKESLAQLV